MSGALPLLILVLPPWHGHERHYIFYFSGVIMTSCYWDVWGIMHESAAHNVYCKTCFERNIKECELLSPFKRVSLRHTYTDL